MLPDGSPNSESPASFSTFRPATTPAEAILRLHTLTRTPPRTRGEKRALVALSDALELDIEMSVTNARRGKALAEALGAPWDVDVHTQKNKVNLAGLNLLLEAAADARRHGRLTASARPSPETLVGSEWVHFNAAISKIEAVTRIAALTGAPRETLGPGSKERKSVLLNLADRLLPDAELDRSSKTRLGRDIAARLGVGWTADCSSTGETISLLGLNTLLAGAERRLGVLGSSLSQGLAADPAAEGSALVAALAAALGDRPWDGRQATTWMRLNGLRGANDNEWQGFYFESFARLTLDGSFPPPTQLPRVRYGSTVFDYALFRPWDLKAHTSVKHLPVTRMDKTESATVVLNDQEAIRAAVAEQGLGFIVLSGAAIMDEDGQFVAWQREQKQAAGVSTARSNSGRSRVRKAAFVPIRIECFWIPSLVELDLAIGTGVIKHHVQGRQAPRGEAEGGLARRPKYSIDLNRARPTFLIASHEWDRPEGARPFVRPGPRD